MKSLVDISDLVENKEIYVDINKKAKDKLILAIKRKYRTYSNFCRCIGLKVDRLSRNNDLLHFLEGHKIQLSLLDKIIKNFDEFTKDYLKENIIRIGNRRGHSELINPKFPINFNTPDGAIFISAILSDGGISAAGQPHYRNMKPELINKVINGAQNVFGSNLYRRIPFGVFFPKIIGDISQCIGLVAGSKVFTDPPIPEFIFESNDTLKCAFLQQTFDDEGYIHHKKSRYIEIGFNIDVTRESKIPRLLVGIQKLLKDLGIKSSSIHRVSTYYVDNNKRERWIITITGKRYLERFKDKIDFLIDYKKQNLELAIKSYKVDNPSLRDEVYNKSVKVAKELHISKGYFTIPLLAKGINRSKDQTKTLVWRMEREDKVKRISDPHKKPIKFISN